MINAKKMKKYFDKKYSDKNTAKMIIGEIKTHIEYGVVDPTFVGKWYEGLSDGNKRVLFGLCVVIFVCVVMYALMDTAKKSDEKSGELWEKYLKEKNKKKQEE